MGERARRGYLAGLLRPAASAAARAPHRIAWGPSPTDPGPRWRPAVETPAEPLALVAPTPSTASATSAPTDDAGAAPSRQEATSAARRRPTTATAPAPLRTWEHDRDVATPAQPAPAPSHGTVPAPVAAVRPGSTATGTVRAATGPPDGAGQPLARLAALSGPPVAAASAAPPPSEPGRRNTRQRPDATDVVHPSPAAAPSARLAATPEPVNPRPVRRDGPAVQIGSIEVIVTTPPAPAAPPAPARPVPAPAVAALGPGGAAPGRLSRPTPPYGLAQG